MNTLVRCSALLLLTMVVFSTVYFAPEPQPNADDTASKSNFKHRHTEIAAHIDESYFTNSISDAESCDEESQQHIAVVEPTVEVEVCYDDFYYDCPLDKNLQDYIRALCKTYNIPMSVVISVIAKESSFRAKIISKTDDYGLMQIHDNGYHATLKKKYGVDNFLDPYQNVFCGISILGENYAEYGDLDMALMAYNLGRSGARKKWARGIYTTDYVKKVREIEQGYLFQEYLFYENALYEAIDKRIGE